MWFCRAHRGSSAPSPVSGTTVSIAGLRETCRRDAYQNRRLVRPDNLALPVTAHHGVPYLFDGRRLVLVDHGEQRTVPTRHAVGLLIPEDEVLEILLFVAAVGVWVGQQALVDFTTLVGGRAYVNLWDCQGNAES